MNTPSGKPCDFYYEDFARGASQQECRVAKHPRSAAWRPDDCVSCRVPGILAANGSPSLELCLLIRPGILGVGRSLQVDAWCLLHGPIVNDPSIGCGECNAEADRILREALG